MFGILAKLFVGLFGFTLVTLESFRLDWFHNRQSCVLRADVLNNVAAFQRLGLPGFDYQAKRIVCLGIGGAQSTPPTRVNMVSPI